jgi:hypothetical protein
MKKAIHGYCGGDKKLLCMDDLIPVTKKDPELSQTSIEDPELSTSIKYPTVFSTMKQY